MMKKNVERTSNFYFTIAVAVMVILFISSSQTYEQQSQVGLLSRLLKRRAIERMVEQIRFLLCRI